MSEQHDSLVTPDMRLIRAEDWGVVYVKVENKQVVQTCKECGTVLRQFSTHPGPFPMLFADNIVKCCGKWRWLG